MVYYEKGSFNTWIKKTQNRKFSDIFSVINGTFSAICSMHECGIVHFDIKPANILLDEDINGTLIAKLTDFGIAQVVENTTLLVGAFEVTSVRGLSLKYAAPERFTRVFKIFNPLEQIQVSKAADTYSMGITIWEALCGNVRLFQDE